MKIEDAAKNIGRKVVYKPWPKAPAEMYEYGVITGVYKYVFVKYGTDVNSKATDACDLEFDS